MTVVPAPPEQASPEKVLVWADGMIAGTSSLDGVQAVHEEWTTARAMLDESLVGHPYYDDLLRGPATVTPSGEINQRAAIQQRLRAAMSGFVGGAAYGQANVASTMYQVYTRVDRLVPGENRDPRAGKVVIIGALAVARGREHTRTEAPGLTEAARRQSRERIGRLTSAIGDIASQMDVSLEVVEDALAEQALAPTGFYATGGMFTRLDRAIAQKVAGSE